MGPTARRWGMTNTNEGMEQVYDVVVLGAGAVGENAADRATRTGLSVAIVEKDLVGGECSYWACMPSKALLRPGAALAAARAVPGLDVGTAQIDVAATLARRDDMAAHWHDDGQAEWLDGQGLALIRGHARFTAPKEMRITPSDAAPFTLRARHAVVVATGSTAAIPPISGLRAVRPWTSREATSATDIPRRLAIIGGGVVAVEMATAYCDLGSEVTIIARDEHLIIGAEEFAGRAVARGLEAAGVKILLESRVTKASRDDEGVHMVVSGPNEAVPVVTADEVLVATGRIPATMDLGIEAIGLPLGEQLDVDDCLEVRAVPGAWLFAAGDVTNRSATTHQGKYDARVAGDVIAARFSSPALQDRERNATAWSRYRATADHGARTQVIFTRPEVATVGLTASAAHAEGFTTRVVGYDIGSVAGAAVAARDYEGRAQLVLDADRDVILGATFVGPDVAELLHAATIAIVGEVPLTRLWHAVPAYPTVSEVWLRLLEAANL